VALLARGTDGLEGARRDVEALGGRALVVPCDVSDEKQVEDAADQTELAFGPIDVWVNNAMVSVFSPADRMTPEEYRRVTDVTYLGFVWGTLAALRRMKPRDRGVVVQVGSALAHRSIPLQSAYCAAKHAVKGFSESVRTELIHDRSSVKITLVELPAVNTPQFDWTRNRLPNRPQPVPPIFQPEVGAEAVFYASQHDVGRELMVAWPTVKATLGNKVIPGLLDHYLADVAWEGEQTNEPEDPDRPDNLFEPVPGDWAAHGRFDHRSKPESWELTLRFNRNLLAVAGAGVLGLALGALTGRKQETGSRKLGAGNGKVAADRADAYDDALAYARADGAAVEPPRAALEPPDSALAALHVPAA
jgi:NAD(P)-dependent dehydrogenase (short-subunit alcohol dehydrogenase family)